MNSRWNDAEAANYPGDLGQRVYSSRLLGRDSALVLHGGGKNSHAQGPAEGSLVNFERGPGGAGHAGEIVRRQSGQRQFDVFRGECEPFFRCGFCLEFLPLECLGKSQKLAGRHQRHPLLPFGRE